MDSLIGQPISRTEDHRLLTGTGRFIDDINLAGQAYVALSRCRTLDGISFNRPLSAADVKCDPLIQSFYRAMDLVADGEAA